MQSSPFIRVACLKDIREFREIDTQVKALFLKVFSFKLTTLKDLYPY